jgi:hypothetical protein
MFNLKFLLLVLTSIFLVLVFSLLQKVQTINFHVKILSLTIKTLLSQSINNGLRASKLVDEFAISVDAHSALSTSLSSGEILFLMQLALLLLLSGSLGYLIWHYFKISSLCAKAVAGVNSFFLSFFNEDTPPLMTFYDTHKNFYTLDFNSDTKTYDFYIKPFNSERTYKFEEFTGLHSEMLNGIKPDILEKISTSTQTEKFIGQSAMFTPEELTNLTSDIVVKRTEFYIKHFDSEKTYRFYDYTGKDGVIYSLERYSLRKATRTTQTENFMDQSVVLTPEEVTNLTSDFINQPILNTPETLLELISSAPPII